MINIKHLALWVFFWICWLFIVTYVSANFTPSQITTTFINKIEKKIDIIADTDFDKLSIIKTKLTILYKKTKNQEIKYIIEKIIQYIAKTIETNDLDNIFNDSTPPISLWIKTLTKWLRPMYEKIGSFYLLRVKPEIMWTPKNLVIQTYFNHDCLELAKKNNLPDDFTFASSDWWKTRSLIKDRPETTWVELKKDGISYTTLNKTICGAFHLKVVYPKQWTIFDEWLAFPILNRGHEYPEKSRCIDMTISADNAQYEENTFCW